GSLGARTRSRNAEDERTAHSWRTLDVEGTLVQLGEAPTEGEAQPSPFLLAARPLVELLELLEDELEVGGGHADPGIAYTNLDLCPVLFTQQGDVAAGGGELDPIGEEVDEDLLELGRVDGQAKIRRRISD